MNEKPEIDQEMLKKLQEGHIELWKAYVQLIHSFETQLPLEEIGFGLIRAASKMILDCSPSHEVAFNTISRAVHEAEKWHKEEPHEVSDN